MSLQALPDEIISHKILEYLPPKDGAALSQTSKRIKNCTQKILFDHYRYRILRYAANTGVVGYLDFCKGNGFLLSSGLVARYNERALETTRNMRLGDGEGNEGLKTDLITEKQFRDFNNRETEEKKISSAQFLINAKEIFRKIDRENVQCKLLSYSHMYMGLSSIIALPFIFYSDAIMKYINENTPPFVRTAVLSNLCFSFLLFGIITTLSFTKYDCIYRIIKRIL